MHQRILIGLLTSVLLAAPVPVLAMQEDAYAEDHEQLRALLVTIREAINEGDVDALAEVMYSPFSLTMIDQALITSSQQLERYYGELMEGEDALIANMSIEPAADTLTEIVDGRVGVVRGGNTETYELTTGRSFVLESRWTATVIKDGGDWKIWAIHAGVNFADNPVLTLARRSTFVFGGGGLLAGLLVGLLGGVWLGRRRPAAQGS